MGSGEAGENGQSVQLHVDMVQSRETKTGFIKMVEFLTIPTV